MAGYRVKVNYRLSASTLIEVVVSMVIIVIVFSIAMGIYTNVLRLSLSVQKYQAQATLHQLLNQLEKSPQIMNQSYSINDLRINKEITLYNNQQNLKEIHLIAFNQNQEKVAEIRKVVYEP
ncbi:MAG: hypothetical protein H7Y07_05285 [Pyrinomonadaceae bacterium]|nr:hypothetical protein [Sphingobacteriaceae bacterium]